MLSPARHDHFELRHPQAYAAIVRCVPRWRCRRRVGPDADASTSRCGYFAVTGEDGRVDDDVLVANLSTDPELLFEIGDFSSAVVGGEWLVGVGPTLRGRRRNRVLPEHRARASIVISPAGRHRDLSGIEAAHHAGDGDGAVPAARARSRSSRTSAAESAFFSWRYSETGEFVDSVRRQPSSARASSTTATRRPRDSRRIALRRRTRGSVGSSCDGRTRPERSRRRATTRFSGARSISAGSRRSSPGSDFASEASLRYSATPPPSATRAISGEKRRDWRA